MENERKLIVADRRDIKQPPFFHVVILNDDFTPMDFVLELIISVFNYPESKALDLMMEVHQTGESIVATYSFDIAETKAIQINTIAQNNEVPLRAEIRPS